ncbi:hypothetical protein RQP46_005235 [Phenoliferia psychrophenolica]
MSGWSRVAVPDLARTCNGQCVVLAPGPNWSHEYGRLLFLSRLSLSLPPHPITMVQAEDAAPAYTLTTPHPAPLSREKSTSSAPPPGFSTFPSTFTINNRQTPALVSTSSLKDHLRLLGAFHDLRKAVESSTAGEGITAGLEPAARWGVFLAIAVHRFELFIEKCVVPKAGTWPELPPLDVCLVWHAYALNPRSYREDGRREHPQLLALGGFPLDKIANLIDPAQLILGPTELQVTEWESRTSTPFDPLVSLARATGRNINDPFSQNVLFVPFMDPAGKGYAQQGFETTSPTGRKITHEVLGIAKLVRDIKRCQTLPDAQLAGTIFSSNEGRDPATTKQRAERVKIMLLLGDKTKFKETDAGKLGETMEWSMAGARKALTVQFKGRGARALNNILSAYTRGELFSLDLVTAVLRQGTFVQKMVDLGWTIPRRFDAPTAGSEEETILLRASNRYFAFLDLISSSPSTFFVPTLDIDLAWHTHQLMSDKYKDDTISLLGRFVDHNDRVEEGALSTAYDVTARFNIPYSICGCPLPSDKLSTKLSSKLGLTSKKSFTPTALLGSTSSSLDCDATHASSHNSVHIVDSPSAARARAKREKEFEERRKRDDKLFAKGKGDPGLMERRRDGHENAFLYPVMLYPYYGMYGYPMGMGGGAGGCGGGMGGSCASGGAAF